MTPRSAGHGAMEEKTRAKKRFWSHRDRFGQWGPKKQRPELWNFYNGRMNRHEHFRVFPLSNWTETDVWEYVRLEQVPLPPLYFAHEREVVERGGVILARTPFIELGEGEEVRRERVRFRTTGDATCTGALRSAATSVEAIIADVEAASVTGRCGRADDRRSEAAVEDRKRGGYFWRLLLMEAVRSDGDMDLLRFTTAGSVDA